MSVLASIFPEPATGLEVVTGNDPKQMLGAWLCHARWCQDKYGQELDHQAWTAQWLAKSQAGGFLQVVVWDGADPVACQEYRIQYDPMAREWVGYGDNSYVAPDYRRSGVLKQMVRNAIATAELLGLARALAPVEAGVGAGAGWLRETYEAEGFSLSGLNMRRWM